MSGFTHYNAMPPYSMTGHQSFASHQSNSHHNHHHHHHGGRTRRSARFASAREAAKQFKQARTPRENPDALHASAFRKDYEAARSFDLEDDEIFCPWHLLTEDDLHSIASSSSDRSSSSSGSPEQSPLQPQLQPTAGFSLSAAANHSIPSAYQHQASNAHLKIHAPLAQRTRNAIPIVDPSTRNISPPTSISPGHMQQKGFQAVNRRWQ